MKELTEKRLASLERAVRLQNELINKLSVVARAHQESIVGIGKLLGIELQPAQTAPLTKSN